MYLTQSGTVDIGHGRGRLAPSAAASLRRVDAALGRALDVNSAWRDPVLQQRMFEAWEAFIAGRGPRPPHGRALPPSRSVHCRGMALDTDDHLVAVLADHGWFRTASDEPWHFEYDPARDNHIGAPAGVEVTPTNPVDIQEDDMKLLYITDDVDGGAVKSPGWVLLNTRTGKVPLGNVLRADNPANQARANGWAAVWGNARSVTRQEFKNAIKAIVDSA